jgi:predicted TIM-barrel fold metal-dependent hydrolase
MWKSYVDPNFRDRAPTVFWDNTNEGWYFGGPEIATTIPVSMYFSADDPDLKMVKRGFESARPGGYQAKPRLADMASEGVVAEVLYTSMGFVLFWLRDAEFQRALFSAYNRWLAELCSQAPDQLVGVGMLSLYESEKAVQELHWCKEHGLRGAMIWASPPDELPFRSEHYETVWAAAADLEMPLSLHLVTGWGRESQDQGRADGAAFQRISTMHHEIERSLVDLVFSGVFERHPRLKVVSVENSIGWVAYLTSRADEVFEADGKRMGLSIARRPSEYVRENVFFTYLSDYVGLCSLPLLGAENFMWSSDYPHRSSTWPNSRKVIDRDFERAREIVAISEDDIVKLTLRNAAGLYGIRMK